MKRLRGTGNWERGTWNWVRVLCALLLFPVPCSLFPSSLFAGVPLRWTVETSRATPATFEAYQGETLELEAALQSYGKPLEAPSDYSLFWQTNGMGSTYWEAPCSRGGDIPVAATNVLFSTWSPTNDVGAKVYNCFIGKPGTIYHAAFQLRLRPSPGALPNELPLPTPVIDFAKVTVLNPPWSGGGGVDTNAVLGLIAPATNRLYKTLIDAKDGAARPLPAYLHALDFDDSYPDAAEEYYRSRGNGRTDGGCSAVRSGGFLSRNFDYPFDDRAEFVVRVSSRGGDSRGGDIPVAVRRFASVGVAQVGTNLTEQIVTSGKPSRWYKALPGATVDGVNENGVVAEINVVDTPVTGWHTTGDLHPLAAVRWALDHATNAEHAATYLAAHIAFPQGWTQNFHYMISDETATYIVENGNCFRAGLYDPVKPVLTNFRVVSLQEGPGIERYNLLLGGANITNAWYTKAYRRETNPPWVSDLADVIAYTNDIYNAWASNPKEYFRNKTNGGEPWWQTLHTSVYDITNRVLRVAVQEVDDWYTFAVPSSGGTDEAKVREIAAEVVAPVASDVADLQSATNALQSQVSSLVTATNNLTSSVSSLESSKVPWVEDREGNLTAVTIGSRESGSIVGQYSLAQGNDVKAEGYYTHAEGNVTHAKDWATHAEGSATRADGEATHAEGYYTYARGGIATHAEGANTRAEGDYTHAEGYYTHASGTASHAEGFASDATNNYAFAWQGVEEYDDDDNPIRYGSHGDGTFNLNPVGGLAGLWIGERNMEKILDDNISTNNAKFVSAVKSVVPDGVRIYDEVRHCWWNLGMVNGVPTWTVEE